jgi:hypothetical protein
MTLLDSTAGCVVNVDDNHRSRTVELRREHMATWSVPVEAMAGARIPADTIFSSQIADLVASVVQDPDRASPHGLVVQDILARMLSCCISESRTPSCARLPSLRTGTHGAMGARRASRAT